MKNEREKIIEKFSEPIYRFCLKRLSCRQDAEDLAQEILLYVFKDYDRMKIKDINAWIWKIARNWYARKIKKQKETPYTISYNFMQCEPDDGCDIVDGMLSDEAHEMVFNALHSLSSLYRDILVDYYVHENTCPEIAKKYNIPLSTVKWRLFSGKEKIKERLNINMYSRTYEKVKLSVMCFGNFNPTQYLDTQIKKVIVTAAYEKPLTIDQISMYTGIPTLYLEDELKKLIYGDAIVKTGNKYATNFIILKNSDHDTIKKSLVPYIKVLSDKMEEALKRNEDDIKKIGFYGSDFGIGKLGYIIIPYIIRSSAFRLCKNNPHLACTNYPLRKDGGCGWFIAHEGDSFCQEECGLNGYSVKPDNGALFYYWINKYFPGELDDILRLPDYKFIEKLAALGYFNEKDLDSEVLANFIKMNIIKKISDRYMLNIAVFKYGEFKELTTLFESVVNDLTKVLNDTAENIFESFKAFVPKRLYDQIYPYIIGFLDMFVYYIIEELNNRSVLNKPEKDVVLADNIFYVDRMPDYKI